MTCEREFMFGSRLGLEAFRDELKAERGRIENETDPAVDVILELLERTIARLRGIERALGYEEPASEGG